jgi:hypothetical protein
MIVGSIITTAFLLWSNLWAAEASSPLLNLLTWGIIAGNVVFLVSVLVRRR